MKRIFIRCVVILFYQEIFGRCYSIVLPIWNAFIVIEFFLYYKSFLCYSLIRKGESDCLLGYLYKIDFN